MVEHSPQILASEKKATTKKKNHRTRTRWYSFTPYPHTFRPVSWSQYCFFSSFFFSSPFCATLSFVFTACAVETLTITLQLCFLALGLDVVRRQLVSWCFKPSQPQRIISGLKESFIKRYIAERTNKEVQSEKAESCRENLWNEIHLKGP